MACPAALEAAQAFVDSCKRLFRTAEIGIVANVVEKTNVGRNAMFRDAVWLLEKAGNASAWMWMENAYPIDRDWMTMVQEEWNAKPLDRLYLGCKADSFLPATDASGKPVTGPSGEPRWRASTPYMRFGVYPPDFHRRSTLFKGLASLPFEIAMRDEIVPVCHESKTLATLWASRNYRMLGARYTGDQSPEYEPAIRKNENNTVGVDGVAVLHGCRDGSLGMLLIGRNWARTENKAKRAVHTGGDAEKIAALEAEIAKLKAMLSGLPAVQVDEIDASPEPDATNEETECIEDDWKPIEEEGINAISEEEITQPTEPVAEESPIIDPPKKRRGRPRKLANA